MTSPSRRVLWVSPGFRAYRRPVLERTAALLATHQVGLDAVHAHAPLLTQQPGELSSTAPSRPLGARRLHVGGRELLVSTIPRAAWSAELVVLPEAIGYLTGWAVLVGRRLARRRVAVFGHGTDFARPGRDDLPERANRWRMGHVDWWFAYNDASRAAVVERGVPADRVTSVQNTLDLAELEEARRSVRPDDLADLRHRLDLGDGPVGIYLGALHAQKQVPLMVEACDLVHDAIPGFRLLVVGDGPSAPEVRAAAAGRPWVRVLPGDITPGRARYWALAEVALYPAWAGLAVNEALAMGVPPVLARRWPHPPEAAYVSDGVNGVVVGDDHDIEGWARAVLGLLEEPDRRARLGAGAIATAAGLGLDDMAERLVEGMLMALSAPRRLVGRRGCRSRRRR